MKYMWVSSVYNFYFNGLMEPHMIVKIIFITCLYLNSIMWVS